MAKKPIVELAGCVGVGGPRMKLPGDLRVFKGLVVELTGSTNIERLRRVPKGLEWD